MKQWKQPMPTDILINENIDTLSRMIFFEIMIMCRNKTHNKIYYHGNKRIDIDIKRGQCLFNISKYERELRIPRRRIEKSLEILKKWYTEMQIEKKPFGCLITMLNYDELIKMPNEKQNELNANSTRTQKQKQECKNEENEENENYTKECTSSIDDALLSSFLSDSKSNYTPYEKGKLIRHFSNSNGKDKFDHLLYFRDLAIQYFGEANKRIISLISIASKKLGYDEMIEELEECEDIEGFAYIIGNKLQEP